MAGSIKWMTYEDDEAQLWSVKTDESNGEIFGMTAFADHPILPITIKKREISFFFNNAVNIKRIGYVGNLTTWAFFIDDPVVDGVQRYPGITNETVTITHFRGERRSVASANDTGINDTDNP